MNDDGWTIDGKRITDPGVLLQLRSVLEDESPLIVEHRFYRGASAPHRFVCDSFETLERYLATNARPGDHFWFWRYEDCCRDDNSIEHGKVPDSEGRVPSG